MLGWVFGGTEWRRNVWVLVLFGYCFVMLRAVRRVFLNTDLLKKYV